MRKPGIHFSVAGEGSISLSQLLIDFNGTLALDGHVLPGVKERIAKLAELVTIFILTSDTLGTAQAELAGWPVQFEKLGSGKEKYMRLTDIGTKHTVAIGNGRNDALMLKVACLGIVVLGPEGAAREAILGARIVARDILDALDLLLNPTRLAATLKN